MCTIFANQHHSNSNVQVTGWLHIRTNEMLKKFTSVLNDVVKVINHVKALVPNSRLLGQLCEEMDAEHKNRDNCTQK